MALEVGKFASEVNAGDSIKIPVQAMNLGRGKIYNVRCSLDVQGLNASKSLFLGNLDGGTAASGELDVFAGMIDEKAESADKRYGKLREILFLLLKTKTVWNRRTPKKLW